MDHTILHSHPAYPVNLNGRDVTLRIVTEVDSGIYVAEIFEGIKRLLKFTIANVVQVRHIYFSQGRSIRDARLGASRGDEETIGHRIRDILCTINGAPMSVHIRTDVDVKEFTFQAFVNKKRLVNIVSTDPTLIQHYMFSEARSVRDAIISGKV